MLCCESHHCFARPDFWSNGSRLAQLPTRFGDRVVGTPADGSCVRTAAGTAGARVAGSSHSEHVVATLCVECLDRDGNAAVQLNGALLTVAIVRWMIVALNAISAHLAAISVDHPAAWSGSRSRSGSWGWRCTALSDAQQGIGVTGLQVREHIQVCGVEQLLQDSRGLHAWIP